MVNLGLPTQHRWKKWVRHVDWPLGGLLLILTLWFGALILSGKMVLPLVDTLASESSGAFSVSEPLWRSTALGEQIQSQFAMDTYAVSRLSEGEFPLWQPRNGYGTPHFAAADAGVLAPTRLLSIFIAGNPETAWMVAVAIAAALGGIFIYLFLRQLQITRPFAALGGLAISMHPALLMTGWLGSLTAMMWLPFLLWQTERHFRTDHTFGPVTLMVAGLAATFYSGDATASLVVVSVWLLYVVVRLIYRWWLLERSPESRPRLLHYGLILLLGLAFAGPQLWAALFESLHSGSAGETLRRFGSEFSSTAERFRTYDWRQLLLMWIPMRYALLWFDIKGAAVEGWLSQIGLFVGMTQAALFALAWRLTPRRRQLWFWTGVFMLSVGIAFVLPSLAILSYAVSALAIVMGMVYGIEAVCSRHLFPQRWLVLILGMLLVLELSWAGMSIWPLVDQKVVEAQLAEQYTREFDVGQTYLLDLEKNRVTLAGTDGQSLASPFAASRAPLGVTPSTGGYASGALDWQGIGFIRATDVPSFVAAGGELSRNLTTDETGVLLHNEHAFPLLYLAKHAVVFGTEEGAVAARDSGKYDLAQTVILESALGDEAIFDPLTTNVPTPIKPVKLVSITPERIVAQVDSAEPALLVRLTQYDWRWSVRVDDGPARVVRANGYFQGVLLAPGLHEVIFEYRPINLQLGGLVFLVGLVILVSWWVRILRRRRHQEHQMQEHFHVV